MSQVRNVFGIAAVCLGLALSGSAFASAEGVAERIKPVGDVCLEGSSCAAAPVAAVASAPRSGEEVYNGSCVTCHGAGVAGAPKFGDAAAWGPRIAQGADTLYTHALNGFNAMPAKGLCMTCSDDEVKAAVDYMANNSK